MFGEDDDDVIPILFLHSLKDAAESDYLWDQGVDLDDWDYMLVIDNDAIETNDTTDCDGDLEITPRDYDIQKLLQGSCSNKWYRVGFRGRRVIMGIAYHS